MKTNLPAPPIKSSTQSFLEVEDIKDGVVILKDGSCVMIISTTAINFGLLSEREQDSAIYAYGALLNSLTFTIQILIRSKKKDISSYLKLLKEQEKKIVKKSLKDQIQKYYQFVQDTVQTNNVLEKSFYIIIPMSSLELGLTAKNKIRKGKKSSFPRDFVLEKAQNNLSPKKDHLIRLLNRLGLRSRQLDTQELVKLFFGIYNPDSHGQVLSPAEDYQTPLVKPAANFPQPQLHSPSPTTKEETAQVAPSPTPTKTNPTTRDNPPTTQPPIKPQIHQEKEAAKPQPPTPKISVEIVKPDQQTPQKEIDNLVRQAGTSTPIFDAKNSKTGAQK